MFEPDYESDTPVYRQIADVLRRRIEAGEIRPRRPLPAELRLQQEFGVARDTLRRAIAHLVELGLVYTVRGRGTFVRANDVTVVNAGSGARIFARRPTEAEKATLDLAEDVWVLVIERPDGELEVLPGDAAVIQVGQESSG